MRIAINGLGRIGRSLVRLLHERRLTDRLELVAINDLADFSVLAHLLQFDSTHGRFGTSVSLDGDRLTVGDKSIQILACNDVSQLPWKKLNIDCVVDCSGKFKTRASLEKHCEAGAGRVIASHPVNDADLTVVYGLNHRQVTDQRVISNASCTTNCLAPLVQVLDEAFGVEQGLMTTIHAYTNDQNLVDKAHNDPLRARAAAVSMIPTSTGAARAVGKVLPQLAGKLDGMSVRVPVLNVSLVDFQGLLKTDTSIDAVHRAYQQAAYGPLKDILSVNELPLVSCDFNHQPYSCIVDANQTRLMGRQLKVMAWYDNEWGFSNRLVDLLLYCQTL